MEKTIFINENLHQFDISDFEYIGLKRMSEIETDSNNILMVKSLDCYKSAEVVFNFLNKVDKKNYYFLINDFGFIKYSNQFSEKYNLFPIIEEYHETSLIIHDYLNSSKIYVDNNDIQIHCENGVRIYALDELLASLAKYYPKIHSSFVDELEDFSFKMTIKKDNLNNIDESMMTKLLKQFNVKELPNGNKEFYKLKFSYDK